MFSIGEIYCLTSPSGKKYIGQCVKYYLVEKNGVILVVGKNIYVIQKQRIIVDFLIMLL